MEISRSDVMMGYVESYYRESLFYTAQNNAKGKELDMIHAIIEDMPNQFNPQTATWGLGLWEEMLGITREAENIADRRSCVMMKLLTLQRITPISLERLIKNVAGANVDVIRNIAPYTFQVRIRDDSLDCNSGLIRRIVEDYKEAHMAFYQAYYLGQIVIKEHFYFSTILRMAVYWFGEQWILNGGFLLDGSQLLNTEFPPYKLKVFHRATLTVLGVISVKAMWTTFKMKNALRFEMRGLFRYEICCGDSTFETKIMHRVKVDVGERFSVTVTITHNLWYLDGTVLLDGSQTLDAYQSKEVLE